MSEALTELPLITLRGMTILPYMVIHFDVNRKKSIKSLDYAMRNGQQIFLATQKSAEDMEPDEKDVYMHGTVCEVKQLVKLPGNIVRVLVRGLYRAECDRFASEEEHMMAYVRPCEDEEAGMTEVDRAARMDLLKEVMQRFYISSDRNQGDNVGRLRNITSLDELIYKCCADATDEVEKRQALLDEDSLEVRFDMVCDLIYTSLETAEIKKELAGEIKARVEKNQREYIMREQMGLLKEELGEGEESEAEEFRKRVEKLEANDETKEKLLKEIKRFESTPSHASDSYVIRSYIETLLDLPWNHVSLDNNDISHAGKVLEKDHYGLKKVKERVLEYLAVRNLTGGGEQPILCLVGPPGTGKTSIATSIAKALDRKYVRICLGGVRDEAEIRGHRKTYVGAMPGRIVEGLRQAGTANPLMLLDEVDKVGNDQRGDTASALLEILDSAQNKAFRDHYVELPVDLHEVLFLATANDTSTIPKPLLDRMDIIEINTYTPIEKFHIAKDHLIPKQARLNGLDKKQVSITDEAVRHIIADYTRESGVRELERQIGKIYRKTAASILEGETDKHKVTAKNLASYLGPVRYLPEDSLTEDQVGVVRGLAWTSVGGTTLDVEAVLMPGTGKLELTGQLGDVMKESANVALGYIKSQMDSYGIDPDIFTKKDIHVHVPEGAVPKDGPSAGITLTLAMLSACTGRKVSHHFAMTGEMTLHGKVLPIGGLKEKLLAAKLTGTTKILIPYKNERDLEEIREEDASILEGLTITTVRDMSEVVAMALKK